MVGLKSDVEMVTFPSYDFLCVSKFYSLHFLATLNSLSFIGQGSFTNPNLNEVLWFKP